MTRSLFAALALVLAPAACRAPELAEMPARCSDGQCPEGYDCIHGVCAKPGTEVPISVATLTQLRTIDLRVLPQTNTALITWQTYAYSAEGQAFFGVRLSADGVVSPRMTLVDRFEADPISLEPYFDVHRVSDEKLLLTISASPLPDDDVVESRLITYRVQLPPEGSESQGAKFTPAWDGELRLSTVGYGAVSSPKIVERADHLELGYFRSRTDTTDPMAAETIGELGIFSLDQDGTITAGPDYHRARDGSTIAIGVVDAFATTSGVWWALDNSRPSALFVPDATSPAIESQLERLGVCLEADESSLLYLRPSTRLEEKLPTDPVSGNASLRRVTLAQGGAGGGAPSANDATIGDLFPVRDTPPPIWIQRDSKPSLLITPGAEIAAPEISVFTVDAQSAQATKAATITRLSSLDLVSVQAALVNGKLFVVWAEQGPNAVTIRASVITEP